MLPMICRCCGSVIRVRASSNFNICAECEVIDWADAESGEGDSTETLATPDDEGADPLFGWRPEPERSAGRERAAS